MDAQDRYQLLVRVDELLVAIGVLMRLHVPDKFGEAAALYASIANNELLPQSAVANNVYAKAIGLRLDRIADEPCLPEHASGRFPFNTPAPYLWQRQPQIEAMLAPLSDKRQRAHKLSTKAKEAP